MIIGFDPETLRELVDRPASEARLAELGDGRSTAVLAEKAGLLRMLGRLDEALTIAEQAFRLAHFGGDREELTRARLRRAQVFQYKGEFDRALTEMVACEASAAREGWTSLEAFAAQHSGKVLFELGRFEDARVAFEHALALRVRLDAPAVEVESSRYALSAALREASAATRHRSGAPETTGTPLLAAPHEPSTAPFEPPSKWAPPSVARDPFTPDPPS